MTLELTLTFVMAEAAGFRVMDPTYTQINVIRGRQVYTAYSHYSIILGTDQDWLYHEIEAQSLEFITSVYPTFGLKPSNDEASSLLPPETVFLSLWEGIALSSC
jgi:hypothetical protein